MVRSVRLGQTGPVVVTQNPRSVEIVEVAPRDGLQSDPTMLSTEAKVELIARLVSTGLRRVEAVSLVNPTRVPQMADASEVMAGLHDRVDIEALSPSYIGLVLNDRGFDRAVEVGVDEVNVVVVCTDTFAEKNQGRPTDALIDAASGICASARTAGIPTSITLAASFGCPYEGEVSLDRFESVVSRLVEIGPDELALADSIGVAAPIDVRERVALSTEVIGDHPIRLRGHFHNTRNTGLANAVAAVESGVGVLDSSVGGIGGCPFAPNATGNIPTEDLLYLLGRMGWPTGVDVDAVAAIVPWVEGVLDHPVPGYLSKAGNFPPRP